MSKNLPRRDNTVREQVTKCWNIVTHDQMVVPANLTDYQLRAWLRLETVLINHGLLVRRPERPSEIAMRKAAKMWPKNGRRH